MAKQHSLVPTVNCRVCWQAKSCFESRCRRCGDVDPHGPLKALLGASLLATLALVGTAAVVLSLYS